jgi:hypothetical protein
MPAAPKFQPRRRNAAAGPMVLPADGRKGRTPRWPLSGKATVSERTLWAELWHTPQAVAWEALGWTRVVARYVRVALAAEELAKDAMAEARQLEDRLGLTPKAMRLLLWTIEAEEPADERKGRVVVPGRWRDAAVG